MNKTILILLVGLVIGGFGYYQYQQYQVKKELDQALSELNNLSRLSASPGIEDLGFEELNNEINLLKNLGNNLESPGQDSESPTGSTSTGSTPKYDPVDQDADMSTYLQKQKELGSLPLDQNAEGGKQHIYQMMKSGAMFKISVPLSATGQTREYSSGDAQGAQFLSGDYDLRIRHVVNIGKGDSNTFCRFILDKDEVAYNVNESRAKLDAFESFPVSKGSAVKMKHTAASGEQTMTLLNCIPNTSSDAWILDMYMKPSTFEDKYRDSGVREIFDSFEYTN